MLAIGIDEQTAEYSLEYTLHMLPGIWLTGYFDAIRNFLIAQKEIYWCMWISITAFFLHIALSHLFVDIMDMGWHGSPWAMNIACLLTLLGFYVYIKTKS